MCCLQLHTLHHVTHVVNHYGVSNSVFHPSSPSTPSSPLLPIPTHALSPGQQGPFTADHTGRVSLVKTTNHHQPHAYHAIVGYVEIEVRYFLMVFLSGGSIAKKKASSPQNRWFEGH